MLELFTETFDTSDFPPRWYCGNWSAAHGWTHIAADLLIALAYFAIPALLVYFVRRRRDAPFLPVFWWFSAFILTCGLTHLVEAVIFWNPLYRVSALLKVATAVASWGTLAMLVPTLPRALGWQGLAEVNKKLEREVEQRTQVEAELREALAKLHATEERFRVAIESAPTAIVMVDADGRVVLANKQTETLFGYEREELVGRSVETLVPERSRGAHAQLRRGYQANPEPRGMGVGRLLTGRRRDGAEFPIEIGLNPVESADGSFVLSTITDVTERIENERAVRESEQRLDLALKNANVGLWDWDLQTERVYVSPTYNMQLGFEPEKTWSDVESLMSLVHPEDRPKKLRAIQECVEQEGRQYSVNFRIRRRGGDYCWMLAQGGTVKAAPGGSRRLIGVHVDITESQRLLERLQHANDELESVAYVASHDLKAPLRAISQIASWLAEDLGDKLPEASAKHLQQLQQRVNRMSRLLSDLLEYARLGQGRDPLQTISLDALLDSVLELAAPPEGFEIRRELSVQEIVGHPTTLATALRNLVGNAVKHHDRQAGKIVISSRPADAGDGLMQFSVADDGPGIDPAMRGRVFQMFQTLRPRDQVEGSGMGLALVKKLVDVEGGSVWVEANSPRGAVVCFTWPVHPQDPPQSQPPG